MEFQSYEILEDFEKALIDNGFRSLPTDPGSKTIVFFYELYSDQFRERIVSTLSADLQKLFPASISLIRDRVYFNDIDARGLTYVKLRFSLTENNHSFELVVECPLFPPGIMVWFDDPEILRAPFSKQTLQVLQRFKNVHGYVYSIGLASLGLSPEPGWFSVFWRRLFRTLTTLGFDKKSA